MSVLDHFSIIEAICKHLDFKTLQKVLFVSKKCAKFFRRCQWIQNAILCIKIHNKDRTILYFEAFDEKTNTYRIVDVKQIRNKIGLYLL